MNLPANSTSMTPQIAEQTRGTQFAVTAQRYAATVKWVSIALIVASLFVLVRLLPLERGVAALSAFVEGLGFWGPLVFGAAYVIAAVLFVPGSALTLASGALFGLWWGTLTVSLASTTAAAMAFLIARYLARNKVQEQAQKYPKFHALDKAIGHGGWRIIAMLRLSPAVPFSLGNYLFGLTAIRFWPYVLASWIAMLPGTFMYVYLGHLGRVGLESAAHGEATRPAGQWVLLLVGLIATVAVTVYITRLARKALKEAADLDDAHESDDGGRASSAKGTQRAADFLPLTSRSDVKGSPRGIPTASESSSTRQHASHGSPTRWPWGATVTALVAFLMMLTAACAYARRDLLAGLFGPPAVMMVEAYEEKSDGPVFDHSLYNELLNKYVSRDGWVNYEALSADKDRLLTYIRSIAEAPFDDLGRNEKLALLINAYNAFTLQLILEHYPLKSIQDIPAARRWDHRRWQLASHTFSLNQIEHEQIRPKFTEPRIHFALVCAAIGCPPLRNEAYTGRKLEQQLQQQSDYVHTHDRWFRFDRDRNVVYLTKLYDWYGGDFEQVAGSVLDYAARYAPALKDALAADQRPEIRWLDYDWTLNDRKFQ